MMHQCLQIRDCCETYSSTPLTMVANQCACMEIPRTHLESIFRVRSDLEFNRSNEVLQYCMSAVRSSVEWLFGDIINYFKFLNFKKSLKIGLSSIGKMYIVSALL